jgi:hypothetical protein
LDTTLEAFRDIDSPKKEHTSVQENVSYGECRGASTSRYPPFGAPYNNEASEKLSVNASRILAPGESLSKEKYSSKHKGSFNDKRAAMETIESLLKGEELSDGDALEETPWNTVLRDSTRLDSISATDWTWNLDLPNDVPEPIAVAIELCLSPDATGDGLPHAYHTRGAQHDTRKLRQEEGRAAGASLSDPISDAVFDEMFPVLVGMSPVFV